MNFELIYFLGSLIAVIFLALVSKYCFKDEEKIDNSAFCFAYGTIALLSWVSVILMSICYGKIIYKKIIGNESTSN